MIMKNRELFLKDPVQQKLPNNGVANVNDDMSDQAMQVLRYELESFVCDGQYADGLYRILETYLRKLNMPQQDGVWVSGFFGSGKSHLVKMLRALWVDTTFNDGASARGIAELPQKIRDQLKELSVISKRYGGVHAISGTLGSGSSESVRLALLQILFKSVGLPTQYPIARFVMRLQKEAILEQLKEYVEAHGYDWQEELDNFYIAEGLHEALVAIKPNIYPTVASCVETFNNLYPNVRDISNDEMLKAITDVLTHMGERQLPLTLIVLDEVQQYIGTNLDRSDEVQEVVESISKNMRGPLMFIGTGQTAITGMSNLKKLEGRFMVRVELSETDVEAVIRKVVLAKKPDAKPIINQMLQKNLGEISRHLSGTSFAHQDADQEVFSADYPILPVRRRFWEQALRVLDQTGTDSQLRNQLSMIHKVVKQYADKPLGHVVPADYLYFESAEKLLQAHLIPSVTYGNIQRWFKGTPEEKLTARACALIYLINKISDIHKQSGLQATVDTLADLMIEDLEAGSSTLRSQIPKLLDTSKLIMKVDNTYRLQTEESTAWNDDFQNQIHNLANDTDRVSARRTELLRDRFKEVLRKVSLVQGKTKVPRDLVSLYGSSFPDDASEKLYVLMRNGSETDEKSVRADARIAGIDSPALFVFLPLRSSTLFSKHITDSIASSIVLDNRGMPASADGADARAAMDTIHQRSGVGIKEILDEIFSEAQVFLGGGHEVQGNNLAEVLKEAAGAAIQRLYPKFSIGDDSRWAKVYERSQKGVPDALKVLDYDGEVDKQQVCKMVHGFITSVKKGSDIRSHFGSPEYGWPRDTIDGALQVLLVSGKIEAKIDHQPIIPIDLSRKDISKADFKLVSVVITTAQRLKIRKLFQRLNIKTNNNEELLHVKEFLHELELLRTRAGGEAPSPKQPDGSLVEALSEVSGNEQLMLLAMQKEELDEYIISCKNLAKQIEVIIPFWHRLEQLSVHAQGLEETDVIRSQVVFMAEHRQLLDEQEAIKELVKTLTQVIRETINTNMKQYETQYRKGLSDLVQDDNWEKLTTDQRYTILNEQVLREKQQPQMDVSSTESLLISLNNLSLSGLQDRIDALSTRFSNARQKAVQFLQPKAFRVEVPHRILASEEDLLQWLKEVEVQLSEAIKKGPVIIG